MTLIKKLCIYIKEIPICRELFFIVNSYAYGGDPKSIVELAPIRNYLSRIGYKVFWSFSGVFIFTRLNTLFFHIRLKDNLDVSSLNLDIFPNLLGFGIGIYALIFMLDTKFITWLKTNKEESNISPQIINADLAFPLIVFAIITLLSGLSSLFYVNDYFNFLNAFLFVYGLMMLFELIGFIFFTFFKKIMDETAS